MGKTFELMGLAAFNIFVALILSATFLTGADKTEQVDKLTETNVTNFVREVSQISSGQREDMDSFAMTTYFMNHIADGSLFKTVLRYSLPDKPTDQRELEMDKLGFISFLLQGARAMSRHETRVDIDHIDINADGRKASVITTSYERGIMPIDSGLGEVHLMPVTGTTYCNQSIILSDRIIQMAGAECTTDITFETGF